MASNPQDVGSNVEACLAQSWHFLSGEPMSFGATQGVDALPDEAVHWWVGLNPRGADWSAGVVLSLSGDAAAVSCDYAGELCNIFAGCLTRLYENRDGFLSQIPRCLTAAAVSEMAARATRLHCYSNSAGNIMITAYYADQAIEPHAIICPFGTQQDV